MTKRETIFTVIIMLVAAVEGMTTTMPAIMIPACVIWALVVCWMVWGRGDASTQLNIDRSFRWSSYVGPTLGGIGVLIGLHLASTLAGAVPATLPDAGAFKFVGISFGLIFAAGTAYMGFLVHVMQTK